MSMVRTICLLGVFAIATPGCKKTRTEATVSKPTAAVPSPVPGATAAALPGPSTLLNAADLPTSVTQGQLDAVRQRIEQLTAEAGRHVARIEKRPPTQRELIELNAVFSDTKQRLMTDTTLARLGLTLDPPARKAVARYTKRTYEALMARLAAAGQKHRAARKSAEKATP